MNKQEMIVAFAAARIQFSGNAPGIVDVASYEELADRILAKWPDEDVFVVPTLTMEG